MIVNFHPGFYGLLHFWGNRSASFCVPKADIALGDLHEQMCGFKYTSYDFLPDTASGTVVFKHSIRSISDHAKQSTDLVTPLIWLHILYILHV